MGFSAVFTGGLARGGSVDANLRNTGSHAAPPGLVFMERLPAINRALRWSFSDGRREKVRLRVDGQSG